MDNIFENCENYTVDDEEGDIDIDVEENNDCESMLRKAISDDTMIIDGDGNIIEENWISDDDVILLVNNYLNNIDINNIDIKDTSVTINRFKELDVNIFEVTKNKCEINLVSVDEFIRYIKVLNIKTLFMYSYTDTEYHYKMSYIIRNRLVEHIGDDKAEEIEELVSNFISNHQIPIQTLCICTQDSIGITYHTDISFLSGIDNILENSIRLLSEELELMKFITYNNAMGELEQLFNYLIADETYIKCTNETSRKNYKLAGSFLEIDEFSNIKTMINNRPAPASDEARKTRDFYTKYDSVFEQARNYIKENKIK